MKKTGLAGMIVVAGLLLAPTSDETPLPLRFPLSATSDSPLYTTYAAAPERSEFILDEGYHFLFYDPERGLDFTTDTAGDWGLAFKRGPQYVYALKDLASEPVITVSDPDLVQYSFKPFADIRAEASFFVFSSRAAVQTVTLTNTGASETRLEAIPFLRNDSGVFEDVAFHPQKRAVSFSHEELPDSWVLSHGVPYPGRVRDVFSTTLPDGRVTSYRSFRWGNVTLPRQNDLEKKPRRVIWGRRFHSDGQRCGERPPEAALTVIIGGDARHLVTETAPRWGSPDENIDSTGSYAVELGHFGPLDPGQEYRLTVLCRESGQSAVLEGRISDFGQNPLLRRDLHLAAEDIPPPPQGLNRDIWGNGTEVRLYWKPAGEAVNYSVYRRDYRRSGVYERLADNLERTFYSDKNIGGDPIYGYVVLARDSRGRLSMHSEEVTNISGSDFLTDIRYPDQIANNVRDLSRVVALPSTMTLRPGQRLTFSVIRLVAAENTEPDRNIAEALELSDLDIRPFIRRNEELFSRLPGLETDDPDQRMLDRSGFNLMRQVMLPPEGRCGYNSYVFSREPTWGWGHGGQVFHESLAMLAYALLDPDGAMDSQRVFAERQHADGYINYRTGPYLDETIPFEGRLTTSAPWFAWLNWEIFRITGDRGFLNEMYQSSRAFYEYITSARDSDGDGLYEWGGHAVLESVRDSGVAVWDEVGWPANFEALDLNCMLVMEARSLAEMARELGMKAEAVRWDGQADRIRDLINLLMWDEETGFYYHIDRLDHDFSFSQPDDLKRQEIIGLLPLWAGIASRRQADRLIEKLRDPEKFWRPYGIPSLSADDPFYNPKGYWNGPVWVQWNFLVCSGLLRYGYVDTARQLVGHVSAGLINRLKRDHQFWEFYSPDEPWAGYHRQYIWAGLIGRMQRDVEAAAKDSQSRHAQQSTDSPQKR